MYTLAMAKNDKKEGWITKFAFVRKQDGQWMIELKNDDTYCRQLSTSRDSSGRSFKTLDAAVSVVEEIGFDVSCLVVE